MLGFVSKTVILLVDDDAERMASTQAILHGDGHAVFSAPTAEAAVKLCTMLHFDLIVSRVMLPLGGMGGVALAQSPEGSKVRMLLTSHVSRKLLETIPGFVDYDFLPNPFTPDQLIRKVRKRLQQPV